MTTRAEIVSRLIDIGIIAVVRTDRTEEVMPIAEALIAGGISAVEITLTIPKAETAIAGIPCSAASVAAATVPEYMMSSPIFVP